MPSFTLTPDEARIFRPLPGHALLRVLPLSDADLKDTPDSLIYKPESAAQDELEAKAVRRGELVCITWTNPGSKELDRIFRSETEYASTLARHYHQPESDVHSVKWDFNPGCIVWYLGRANESDNQYVIVKVLQIVALETPDYKLRGETSGLASSLSTSASASDSLGGGLSGGLSGTQPSQVP